MRLKISHQIGRLRKILRDLSPIRYIRSKKPLIKVTVRIRIQLVYKWMEAILECRGLLNKKKPNYLKCTPDFNQRKVACEHCTFEQNVPGNTQVYVCCCCNNMNECFPLYGLFICGCCQGKVCYPYGTSDMIRCTRCGTVNRVPT